MAASIGGQFASNVVSKERLYLNRAGDKVVREGDPEAFMLIAAAGTPVPAHILARFPEGLPGVSDPAVAEGAEPFRATGDEGGFGSATAGGGEGFTSPPETAPQAEGVTASLEGTGIPAAEQQGRAEADGGASQPLRADVPAPSPAVEPDSKARHAPPRDKAVKAPSKDK